MNGYVFGRLFEHLFIIELISMKSCNIMLSYFETGLEKSHTLKTHL